LRYVVFVFLLAALALDRPAVADPATIVLLETRDPSEVAKETLVRTRWELQAAGFTVVVVNDSGSDTKASLEIAVAAAGAVAAIALEDAPTSNAVDVWVNDRLTNKLSIRRVEAPATAATPELVAIRTVELLRASLIELRDPAPTASPTPPIQLPPAVEKLTTPALARHPTGWRGFGIEIGAAGLFYVDPAGAGIAPLARVSYGTKLGVGARLTWIGPSLGPSIPGALGRAAITQELAIAEVLISPPLPKPFELAFSAGAGVTHVSATGNLRNMSLSLTQGATAFAFDIGVDAAARVTDNFAIDLGTLVSFDAPRIAIDMGKNVQVGTIGRPTLGATAGVRTFFF
jgi:hypothetical protein